VLKQFLNHIDTYSLCTKGTRILLAVSGGLDSLVMLHLFKQAGFTFGVAHCNFQLRGEESDGDEQFVHDLCRDLKTPYYTKRFDTAAYCQHQGLSVQMGARKLRYSWFDELLNDERYEVLATAHHLNDSLETILLNWTKGTSLDGLTGIPVRNGNVIRPLLFATREAMENYATENNLRWREDSSNATTDYQRNLIRHQIIPVLKSLNPSLENTVQKGIERMKGESELLGIYLAEWTKKFLTEHNQSLLLDKVGLEKHDNGAILLWKIIQHLGFSYETCVSIINSLGGQPGKRFIGEGYELNIDRNQLIVFPVQEERDGLFIQAGQVQAMLGVWSIALALTDDLQFHTGNPYQALLDADKLSYPLQWRYWKAGDTFFPLGMDHHKKVSDLLIDEKVSVADKAQVTVLESAGDIIWVVGHRIDNRYKITTKTRHGLSIRVIPHFS
jgi:tRNA(Ile)-lysidine synthase